MPRKGDLGNTTESELTAAATDEEALNPTAGSAGLYEEVKSVSIGVSSEGTRANESGRDCLVRLAALGFGFGQQTSGMGCNNHPLVTWGMKVDCKNCIEPAERLGDSRKSMK